MSTRKTEFHPDMATIFNNLKKGYLMRGDKITSEQIDNIFNSCKFPKGKLYRQFFVEYFFDKIQRGLYSWKNTDEVEPIELRRWLVNTQSTCSEKAKAYKVALREKKEQKQMDSVLNDEVCIKYLLERGFKVLKPITNYEEISI